MTKSAKYIDRSLEKTLKRAVSEFPAVVLTGPRQSGKTTILKNMFGSKYGYVSLETPDVRHAATSDPRTFLETYQPPVIFDEIQYAPDLLMYIKEHIDANREKTGQFLLTGSQNLLLSEKISESLAGRSAILRLLPLSFREAAGNPNAPLCWESKKRYNKEETCPELSGNKIWNLFLRGNFPELVASPKRDTALWHGSYVQTYIERDIRSVKQIGNLTLFQSFLKMLAARSGQLLNLTDLGRDIGVTLNTAKTWLSVLEATYQVFVLRPYFTNIGKRLVKTPKVYFTDVGTLCYLAGLKDPDHAAAGPMCGAIMETAVLSEILKTFIHRGEQPQLYFWRTSKGNEVDIIIETERKLIPIEVKTSGTPNQNMAKGILSFQKDLGDKSMKGYVIHPGKTRLPLAKTVEALPFALM